MPSQLAQDETRIAVDHTSTIHLRPTLRAAMRLERRHGGFAALLRGVTSGSVTIMADVIRESADRATTLPDILSGMHREGLGPVLTRLTVPLVSHILALAGLDPDDLDGRREQRKAAAAVTFAEHHTRLYRIATGWLGWPPETAWSATPAEITEAYAGHLEMLKAIHGVTESKPAEPASVAAKFRALFASRGFTTANV